MNNNDRKDNSAKSVSMRFHGKGSMKLHVFLGILLMGAVITLVIISTVRSYVIDKSVAEKVIEMREYVDRLSTKISSGAYMSGGSDDEDINREINTASSIYEGRIIIINNTLKVIYDTYGAEVGKTLISSEAVKALRGEFNQYVDRDNMVVELTIPIALQNGEISADTTEIVTTGKNISGAVIVKASISGIYDVIDLVDQRIAFIIIVMSFLLVLASYFFCGYLTRPLKKLEDSVKHVADGYMDDKVNVSDYRETAQISDSLNTMLEKIRKMESSRQEFVSNVSHELKTPMTSIKVLADSLLTQEDAPAELYREFLTDINDEIDRENKIITDLLSLVKLDKKHGEMNIAEVSINELLEIVLKRIKPIAQRRNIELVFESYRPVLAEVDEVKLSLALTNIIENAVKYNIDSGWVHVSLNADHKFFFVKVADSGVGIPEESRDMIFDRFYRVDKTRSRETGGTGLGLAITKNVIMMHNGSISVTPGEEAGTIFTVKIPLSYIPQ